MTTLVLIIALIVTFGVVVITGVMASHYQFRSSGLTLPRSQAEAAGIFLLDKKPGPPSPAQRPGTGRMSLMRQMARQMARHPIPQH